MLSVKFEKEDDGFQLIAEDTDIGFLFKKNVLKIQLNDERYISKLKKKVDQKYNDYLTNISLVGKLPYEPISFETLNNPLFNENIQLNSKRFRLFDNTFLFVVPKPDSVFIYLEKYFPNTNIWLTKHFFTIKSGFISAKVQNKNGNLFKPTLSVLQKIMLSLDTLKAIGNQLEINYGYKAYEAKPGDIFAHDISDNLVVVRRYYITDEQNLILGLFFEKNEVFLCSFYENKNDATVYFLDKVLVDKSERILKHLNKVEEEKKWIVGLNEKIKN